MGICRSFGGWATGPARTQRGRGRVGDPAVRRDVLATVDTDLGDDAVVTREVGELVEVVDEDVLDPVQRGDALDLDAARSREQDLELVAVDLLGLGVNSKIPPPAARSPRSGRAAAACSAERPFMSW